MCFSSTVGGLNTHTHNRPFSILEKGKHNIPFFPGWKIATDQYSSEGVHGRESRGPEWRCDLCEATRTRQQHNQPQGRTAPEDPQETAPQAGGDITQVDGKRGIAALVLSGAVRPREPGGKSIRTLEA